MPDSDPMLDCAEQVSNSETRITRAVFPDTTNHYDTLFGGTALEWMDECAFITATRFSRQKFVTVSVDRTDFQVPIPAGTIVELIGRIQRIGNTSIKVRVELHKERMYEEHRELAVVGEFTLVAIGSDRTPVSVNKQPR